MNSSETETYDDYSADPTDMENTNGSEAPTIKMEAYQNESVLESWDDSNFPKSYIVNRSYQSSPVLSQNGYTNFSKSVESTNHDPLDTPVLPEINDNINSGSLMSMTSQVY